MQAKDGRRDNCTPERNFANAVLLFAVLLLTWIIAAPGPAPAATDLTNATEKIVARLTAELSTGSEGSGRIGFVVPPVGLVAKFERSGARPDGEYLLMRDPEKAGSSPPQVIGAARVTAVREDMARAVLLWSNTTPRPGDRLVAPSRMTIFLAPTHDLAHNPGATAGLVDQLFELALSNQSRLQVVRLQGTPDPAQAANQLKSTAEIGLLFEPLLLPDPTGVRLAAKVRSVLSGHTTASYAEALSITPQAAQPAPVPAPPPSVTHAPPPTAPEKREAMTTAPAPGAEPDVAPPGFVFTKKEAEPGDIVAEAGKAGPIRKEVTESLIAITAAELDGAGRPELVGVSKDGVFAYRWTDKGFTPLTGHIESEKFVRYLTVDAADISGNGRDEIFVTAISSIPAGVQMKNALRSLVLELDGNRLKVVARDLPYYFRVVRIPGQTRPLLLAQKMGTHDPFNGPILKMAWKGGQYVEDGTLSLPGKGAWIYDVSIVEVGEAGATTLAAVNGKGHLLVRLDGKESFEGKEGLGKVEHVGFFQTGLALKFRESPRAMTQARAEDMAEWRVLARRILAEPPLFGSGKVELITVANRVHYGLQVRLFGEGAGAASVVGYIGSGETFQKNWETTPVEGEARDVALADFDGDGRPDVVLLSAIEERASLNLFLLRPGKGA